MSKPNPEDYEYVEVEVDEEEEEENQEEVEVEVDTAQAKRIGTHHKKEKEIKSFADLAVFNRNTQKLEEEVQARGALVSLTLVFPDKKSHVIKVVVISLVSLFFLVRFLSIKRLNMSNQLLRLNMVLIIQKWFALH